MDVWFYHLERSAPEAVLPELLEKTLARGWRAVVRAPERHRLERLDEALWGPGEAFLPHGLDDADHPDRQPILLTSDEGRPNGAQALFLLDGADAGDLDPYERCIVLFDGADETALGGARDLWRTLKAAGRTLSYWQQGESGWRKRDL